MNETMAANASTQTATGWPDLRAGVSGVGPMAGSVAAADRCPAATSSSVVVMSILVPSK
jgi:hypothetical protein